MRQTEKQLSGYAHAKPRAKEAEGFRPDIEGLRGIAVGLVVIFHAGLLTGLSEWGEFFGHKLPMTTGGFIGVDLFFVISGFLITGLLVREREKNGRISFSKFYARRVRRILPAAVVVLIICLPIAYQLTVITARPSVMQDGASAALSIANIRFAQTTDYFNPVNYSPFLHFWSLGVEEQFYFVWPAVMALVAWKWPRPGATVALATIIVVSFLASLYETDQSASTAFYMLPTRAWQLAAGGLLAVLATTTDVIPRRPRRLLSDLLGFAGWAALFALLTAAFAIDSKATPYPGMAAIVPTIAGVLLIASGTSSTGPGMLLRLPPVRFLGKISYSLYLWHWPVLILGGLYLVGPLDSIDPIQAIALAVLAVPIATLSWYFVEEPFRRGRIPLPRPSRVVMVGVSVMAIVAIMGATFDVSAQTELNKIGGGPDIADASPTDQPTDSPAPDVTDAPPTPTAAPTPRITLPPGESPTPMPTLTPAVPGATPAPAGNYAIDSSIRPALGRAATDYEQPWRDNCLGWKATTAPSSSSKCVYGTPSGSYTVALVGDSHASALFPGVNVVAKAHGWRLVPYLKIDCSFLDYNDLVYYGPPTVAYPECMTWNKNVLAKLNRNPPDLILISMSRWIFVDNNAEGTVTAETQALVRMINKLPASSRVVIIQDPPLPTNYKIPDCLATYLNDYRKCAYTKKVGFASSMGAREIAAAKATSSGLIDLTDAVCPGSGNYCQVVINDMIAWRDQHHLTATFAASLAPAIDSQLVAILNQWDLEAAGVTPVPSAPPSAAP